MMSSLSSLLESLLPLFRGGATSRLAATTPPPSPSPSDSLDHDEDSSSGDSSTHPSIHPGIGLTGNKADVGARRSTLTLNQRTGAGTSKYDRFDIFCRIANNRSLDWGIFHISYIGYYG